MFRRIWFWLREVVWTAVVAVLFVVSAVVLQALSYESWALLAVIASIPFALLSMRS